MVVKECSKCRMVTISGKPCISQDIVACEHIPCVRRGAAVQSCSRLGDKTNLLLVYHKLSCSQSAAPADGQLDLSSAEGPCNENISLPCLDKSDWHAFELYLVNHEGEKGVSWPVLCGKADAREAVPWSRLAVLTSN